MKPPHPIPYQGSKRNIADDILYYFPDRVSTLIEPFVGSAAISIAAAMKGLARHYWLNDLNKPLMDLWEQIINHPEHLSQGYDRLWHEQQDNPREYYDKIRSQFNLSGKPQLFLYLLARCVKASVRYNSNGEFNQSPDNRRCGAKPNTMRNMILGVSALFKGKSKTTAQNYRDVLQKAECCDLVYMDPPYQGVSGNRDSRYLTGVQFFEFVEALQELNQRCIRYIVSYDGRTGEKMYGASLPPELSLTRVEIQAGRSSQATLLGRKDVTIESLYLSPALSGQLSQMPSKHRHMQMSLFGTDS
ncbi:MAG: DNA adenine methylase [Magnetococcales bacterium]|nr:DNA adenine methylase [Magnetococcales bacterium]